jgi:hypothetical protein
MDTSGDLFATALSHMEADADADAPGPASARGGPPPHAYGPGSASRLANSDTLDSREGERAAAPALAGSSPAPGAGGGSSAAEDCMVSCADQSAAAIMARSQPGMLEGSEAEGGAAGSGHTAGTDPKGGGDQGAQARGGNSRAPARGPVCGRCHASCRLPARLARRRLPDPQLVRHFRPSFTHRGAKALVLGEQHMSAACIFRARPMQASTIRCTPA